MILWITFEHYQPTKVDVSNTADVDNVKAFIGESLGLDRIHHARLVLYRHNRVQLDPMRSLLQQGVSDGERCFLTLLPPVNVGSPRETVCEVIYLYQVRPLILGPVIGIHKGG